MGNLKNALGVFAPLLFCLSCSEVNVSTMEPAPSAEFIQFVTRDYVVEHKIKKVDMVITRSTKNPFTERKENGDRISGIDTSYYFSPTGLLDADGVGYNNTITHYYYDERDQNIGFAWSEGVLGVHDNMRPSGQYTKEKMGWVSKGNPTQSLVLSVNSACYSVGAEFKFVLDNSTSPPQSGLAHLVRNFDWETSTPDPDKTLYVFFKYEFYD